VEKPYTHYFTPFHGQLVAVEEVLKNIEEEFMDQKVPFRHDDSATIQYRRGQFKAELYAAINAVQKLGVSVKVFGDIPDLDDTQMELGSDETQA